MRPFNIQGALLFKLGVSLKNFSLWPLIPGLLRKFSLSPLILALINIFNLLPG